MKYTYKRLFNKDTGKTMGIELADGTIIFVDEKRGILRLGFLKKKFAKLFLKMIKDKKRKYIDFIFSDIELMAILKAFSTKPKKVKR